MPREKTGDVAHEQVTDHRIQKRPTLSLDQVASHTDELTAVGSGPASDRELGLAYFQLAERGDVQAGHRSMQLLEQAEHRSGEQADHDLHTALGLMEQLSGDRQAAMREYQAALHADPADSVAAGDLAILQARAGDVKDAIAGLQWVSEHDPADTSASLDLAMIECATGDPQAAKVALQHLLQFSPDDRKARQALAAMESERERCGR
jgi:Flp pilus assembly protein TadD